MDKQQHLDQLFQLAKQDQAVQSFEHTKERFIASASAPSVNTTKTTQVFTKKWIIMLATVSTISLSLFLLLNKGEISQSDLKPNKTKEKEVIREQKNTQAPKVQSEKTKQGSIPSTKVGTPFLESIQELVTDVPFNFETKEPEDKSIISRNHKILPPKGMDELPYQFPKLTEEEINITNKKKKAMLKALAKHDKDAYVFIPTGSFDYNGKTVSVQAFYMGIGEVTNFEYRTFLFDLLIQGRNDEFLKAKPDQSQWSKMENLSLKTFEEHYFSHKAYNEYPVVNISREGAEIYCKWLSQEVRKYVGDEKEGKYNDVRIPVRAEWAKAASNEGKMLPYPWGGPFTRNSKGLILANYLRLDEEALQTTAGTTSTDVTAPSKSYWPSELGLYNMSGNVAEMVYEGMNRTEPGTAGGSWRNTQEEIKIYAPDPYKGIIDARPMIGFRVVSTYLILKKE
jgi:formylglycine-generating enzyme required for sulfatase activity